MAQCTVGGATPGVTQGGTGGQSGPAQARGAGNLCQGGSAPYGTIEAHLLIRKQCQEGTDIRTNSKI